MTLRVLFAGGGTGGHLFPAIAIADEVKRRVPDAEITFVGTSQKIEARVVPQKGYNFRTIWISGFRRKLTLSNLLFPVKLIVSMLQAFSILKEIKPAVVVGTGGYVSGPMLYAATMKRIPTLIQEQNSYPGETTRLLSKRVNEVHVTFEQSKQYFASTTNVFISGNPTRSDLDRADRQEALRYFQFDPNDSRKTILIFGGSLGAHSINLAVESVLSNLTKQNFRVIWQTGAEDIAHARGIVNSFDAGSVWVNAFIDQMDLAYAASDLVICRAGATTIAELTRLGKPAILVPYPHAAANHQVENAKALHADGAAELVYDHEVSSKLLPTIVGMLDEQRLANMQERSRRLGKPDAASVIAARVLSLAGFESVHAAQRTGANA